eukprot:scaffold117484_cov72-Phaeocystis_antarctica.AAC.2
MSMPMNTPPGKCHDFEYSGFKLKRQTHDSTGYLSVLYIRAPCRADPRWRSPCLAVHRAAHSRDERALNSERATEVTGESTWTMRHA